MNKEIERLISEIKNIKTNPGFLPTTLQESYDVKKVVEALDRAIVDLQSAISTDAIDKATTYKIEDEAIDVAYDI